MQRLEVSGAVRPIYESLGFERLITVMHTGSVWRHVSYKQTVSGVFL